VQRHQLHAVLVRIGLTLAGVEGGAVDKLLQRRQVALLGHEAARGTDQFLEVLHPRLALLALLAAVKLDQPRALHDGVDEFLQRERVRRRVQFVDEHAKALERTQGPRRQQLVLGAQGHRLPQAALVCACRIAQCLQGLVADAARRRVDHALDRPRHRRG
jgi:hypothetical protein